MKKKKNKKYILAVDTVSELSSVAVGDDSFIWRGERKQSQMLLPLIEKLLRKNKGDFRQIVGVGVVTGPGSYTGIRIGVSVVNTLAQILRVPVKTIDTLTAQTLIFLKDGLARGKKTHKILCNSAKKREVVSLLSAGDCRVYARRYQVVGQEIKSRGDFFQGEVNDFVIEGDNDKEVIGELNDDLGKWLEKNNFRKIFPYTLQAKISRAKAVVDNFDSLLAEKRRLALPIYIK